MDGCGGKIGPFDCCTIVVGDCLDVMAELPDGCVNLLFADPPYNKGKADWDKGHDWRTWIPEAIRIFKDNGAFWVIHRDARELAQISESIEKQGGPPFVNWITWDMFNVPLVDKWAFNGIWESPSIRSWPQMAEYLIYHADDGQWQSQCDKMRGFIFEPLRAYLDEERERAGFTKPQVDAAWCAWKNVTQTAQSQKWFSASCWNLPTIEAYSWLQNLFNDNGNHEYLCREYEDLRREYEDLRPSFNGPPGFGSVWSIPAWNHEADWHPTPKPERLLERIIEMTSNPGDLAADFFMGSGTTAVAAQKLGRHFFGCDKEAEYIELAQERLATIQLPLL